VSLQWRRLLKARLFELADKSTLFLDEIGELQPQIQVKLLRVLDGQRITPGWKSENHRRRARGRATNQDLELAVKEGRFADLFHASANSKLRFPLRERPRHCRAVIDHFSR